MMRSKNIVLMSRLALHGQFLYKLLSKHFNVSWVGRELTFKLNLLNFLYVLLREFIELVRLFKRRRYSAIVVQYVSLDGIPALIIKRLFGVKVVLFAIGSDVLGAKDRTVSHPIIRWILARSDLILCASTLIQRSVTRVSRTPTTVVPSLLYVEDFSPYEGPKEYDLITIGSLSKDKNQCLLIEACSLLKNPVKLLIIGDGPMRKFLESASRAKGLDVRFLGKIPHNQVYLELQKSKIYVHVSRREGLPVSVLEAIYCKLPVVLVESAYSADLRRYGFNINVSKGEAEALAQTIERVLSNYDREKRLAILNHRRMKKLMEETSLKIKRELNEVSGS